MKHISEIVRAFIKADQPRLGLIALTIYCASAVAVAHAALGASFRWHDVVWLWHQLS
ncbi:hypothetical protein [Erythrobacter donghaensis]|uniref:hypothetical protein n=1 Tax=Erythrobacter donghaensis TaxID=267135 RepID=UPI00130258ED|nr:hypothetical protein [Erythrobacter donghaensis]